MASSARIDELKKKFDENPRRYFAPLANEFRKAGDIEQAVIICEEFLPQQPGHMSGHIVYGQALYEAGRLPESRTVFETALGLDPENLIALRHLGDIARGEGDTGSARGWYARVLDADPRNEEIQALLASLEGESPPEEAGPSPAAFTAVTFEFQEAPPEEIVLESQIALEPDASLRDTEPSGIPVIPPPIPPYRESASQSSEVFDGFSLPDLEQAPDSSSFATHPHAAAEGLESTSFTPPDEPVPAADLDSSLDSGIVSFAAPEARVESLAGLQGSSAESGEEADIPESASESSAPLALDDGLLLPPQGDPFAAAADVGEDKGSADHPVQTDAGAPEYALDYSPPAVSAEDELVQAGERPATQPLYDDAPHAEERAQPSVTPAPFVTETMAELYLSQGYRSEAHAVYAQLLAANPTDERLQQLVGSLAAPLARADTGPNVRDFLSRIAARRPGARAAATTPPSLDDFASDADVESVSGEDHPEQAPFSVLEADAEAESTVQAEVAPATQAAVPKDVMAPAIERAAAMRAPAGSIDALFGNRVPGTSSDSAASALAQAFGGNTDAPSLTGRPAHAAAGELSLDSVFRDGPARPPRTSQSFSFDQFFTGGASERTPAGGVPRGSAELPLPGGPPAERNADDIEQFTSWLQGLKPK